MPVILVRSARLAQPHQCWVAVAGADGGGLDPARRLPDVPALLERAFEAVAADWQRLALDQRGALSHTAACAPNASDYGEMLAWTRLVRQWACDTRRILVVCDDPWLFRHLALLPGTVAASLPPPLLPHRLRLAVRGTAARLAAGFRFFRFALAARKRPVGPAVLLVYGHPRSTADGDDAYFGTLPRALPGLSRVLHVDATPAAADRLGAASLHAWGSPLAALGVIFTRWRPQGGDWLVRRAAALEGGTAQAAAMAWQVHCQRRFLDCTRPRVVAWPWENHAWERALCAELRQRGILAVGYQHALVGRHEFNYVPSPDLPARVLCSGPASRDQLLRLGHDPDRLELAGALRFPAVAPAQYDPEGPLLVALPFERKVAAELLDEATRAGRPVLVRDHPVAPWPLPLPAGLAVAPKGPLAECGPLAGVVYAASSIGLEARLAGLPARRFLAARRLALDPDPAALSTPGAAAPAVWCMEAPSLPPVGVFDPPDTGVFRRALACDP